MRNRSSPESDRLADAVIERMLGTNMEACPSSLVDDVIRLVRDTMHRHEWARVERNPHACRDQIRAVILERLTTDSRFRSRVVRGLGDAPVPNEIGRHVFLSYRRAQSDDFVELLARELEQQSSYQAVYDTRSLVAGSFPSQLSRWIRTCHAFALVVGPGTLDRTGDPSDWVRREIETAIDAKRPLVPLLVKGGSMPRPDDLAPSIWTLSNAQALPIPEGYLAEGVGRLVKWLVGLRA